MLRIVVSLLMVAALSDARLSAQEAISADRPGFADGPSVVGDGRIQLELGIALDRDDESSFSVPTLLRYGLTSFLELRLESDVLRVSGGDTDFAPVAAGMKLRLREGNVPLSLIASVQPDDLEAEVRLTSDLDLGGDFSLTPNVGISLAEAESATWVVAASLGKDLGNKLPFVDIELRGGDGEQSAIVDGGMAWILPPDIQLDVSGGVRLSGAEYSEWFVSAGFCRRF